MSQKKDSNQLNQDVFTIDLDQHSDSHEIPGVTQLLNPAKMAEMAAAKKEAENKYSLEPTRTVAGTQTQNVTPPPIVAKHPQRLKDLGVLFDFQFTTYQNAFRFQASVPHAESFVQAWQQEVLTDMKLDLKTILFKEPFQEFRHETFGYLYTAFGVQTQHFIQVVQVANAPQVVHVLVSNQSLAQQQEAILSILQQSPEEKAAASELSGVIEIDLAG